MIVGHKTDTYLTTRWQWSNMFNRLIVTKHTVVNELHATKGWRTVRHDRKERIRTIKPTIAELRLNDVTTFERRRPNPKYGLLRLQVRP